MMTYLLGNALVALIMVIPLFPPLALAPLAWFLYAMHAVSNTPVLWLPYIVLIYRLNAMFS